MFKLAAGAAVTLLSISLGFAADSAPDPLTGRPREIVQRYLQALDEEKKCQQDLSMEVDIDAKLPKLKKHGKLHALKFISKLGQIVYGRPQYEGDDTIKRDVIARYLTAEREASNDYGASMGITPKNYKFKYKGMTDYSGDMAYVFQVTPRKKRVGLFKGELWVDSKTYLPLREWGELVKNPSVFLRNVYFVRDYIIYDGMSIPRRMISNIDTRLVGKAEIVIWFNNYSVGDGAQSAQLSSAQTSQADASEAR